MWAVVLAAGRGERFGGAKQFRTVGDERLVDRAVAAVAAAADGVVVVVPPGARWTGDGGTTAVPGGATRAGSVRAGLAAVPGSAGVVVIHDAAHPLASTALVRRVVAALAADEVDGAVPVVPVAETVARLEGDRVVSTTPRAGLALVQMPHAFRAVVLRAAHEGQPEAADDASLVAGLGGRVVAVAGEAANVHVTTPQELAVAGDLVRRG